MNAPVNPLHLLVVDDDDVDRERVQRYLERYPASVIMHEAASGEEALRLVRTTPYDCVVLDNQLGDTTGSELLPRLREEACHDCPFIMVTGAGSEALVVQAMQDGAADYLSKVHLTQDGLVRSVMRSLETHKLRRQIQDMHQQLERRVEEQAATIRQRERDLQDILDHTPSLIGYWDADRCVRFGNRAHQTWLGVASADLPGMPVRQAIGERMHAIHAPHIDQALRGLPQLFEYAMPERAGHRRRHYQAEYRPETGEAGQVLGFYVTITDITQIKAAQNNVEELLRFVEAVIDNSPVGMAVYSADGHCVLTNAEMATVIGTSMGQLTHATLSELARHTDAALFREGQATLRDGQTRHLESTLRSADGQPTQIAWSMARVERGDAPHLLLIAHDVTEQKRLHEGLVAARNVAQEAARVTSAFLANMSHEIRTPMNAIVGLSRLALEETLPPAAHGYIERVHGSALALMGILDDVLDYAKVEAGQMKLEHAEIDLHDVLQRMADLFCGRLAQKRLRFDIELAADVPAHVLGDALRLSQILTNLVGNAVKFTEQGGILVSVSRQGPHLRFAVKDSGIGIDPARREALFAAFAQGDVSITRRYGGTGLGLAICKKLADMMGGGIGVDSNPGQGSTFWFTVPLDPVAEPAAAPSRLRALMLGKDADTTRRLLGYLRPLCETVEASSELDDACQRITEHAHARTPFDAILLDCEHLDGQPGPLSSEAWGERMSEQTHHVLRTLRSHLRQHGDEQAALVCLVHGFNRPPLANRLQGDTGVTVLTYPVLPPALSKILHEARDNGLRQAPAGLAPAQLLRQRGALLAGRLVMLVEDNALNQMVAQAFLRQAGLEVDTCGNGEEAVQCMEQAPAGHYAAILMDMHMPVMDGLEATRRIRRMDHAKGVPIIAMTAAVLPADQQRCQEAGMVDMVTKPLLPEALIDTLLHWVAR